jgi:hypothetical protein
MTRTSLVAPEAFPSTESATRHIISLAGGWELAPLDDAAAPGVTADRTADTTRRYARGGCHVAVDLLEACNWCGRLSWRVVDDTLTCDEIAVSSASAISFISDHVTNTYIISLQLFPE